MIRFPAIVPGVSRFLETLPYDPSACLIDEVVELDAGAKRVRARLDTAKPLPFSTAQRGDPAVHPRHVNGAVMIHLTGVLGLVHAYFLNGLRWDEGWIGFGSRIHRGDFKRLARLGPPLELTSVETQIRKGPKRHVARYEFRFEQEGGLCYLGDQTAIWVHGHDLGEE